MFQLPEATVSVCLTVGRPRQHTPPMPWINFTKEGVKGFGSQEDPKAMSAYLSSAFDSVPYWTGPESNQKTGKLTWKNCALLDPQDVERACRGEWNATEFVTNACITSITCIKSGQAAYVSKTPCNLASPMLPASSHLVWWTASFLRPKETMGRYLYTYDRQHLEQEPLVLLRLPALQPRNGKETRQF